MKLRGCTVVLYGDFLEIGRESAIRRLQALGARVADEVTEETDLIFLAPGERGPVPRTDAMLRTPYFDEDALIGMLEREEGAAPPVEAPPRGRHLRTRERRRGPPPLRGRRRPRPPGHRVLTDPPPAEAEQPRVI
jgi:hypothetical protein